MVTSPSSQRVAEAGRVAIAGAAPPPVILSDPAFAPDTRGCDESDEIGIVPHKPTLELHAEAARNALADAGIDMSEVDGVFSAGAGWSPSLQVAEYLGLQPKYNARTAA